MDKPARALVTGARGMLGRDVCAVFGARGWPVIAADLAEFDLTDGAAARRFVRECGATTIINCAGYTAVDRAECESELAFRVNRDGARNMAEAAAAVKASLVQISTDYVFDGAKDGAYEEDDPAHPTSVYGASKLAGEEAVQAALAEHWIVRTAWLFGIHGKSFPRTMLELARSGKRLRVVNDQVGSPTYTQHLAAALVAIVEQPHYGVYHAVGGGSCTWYELACEVFRAVASQVEIEPVGTADYPTPARRPANSVLDVSRLAGVYKHRLPPWTEGVRAFCEEWRAEEARIQARKDGN